MNIFELCVDHDYYASESNFYSNEAKCVYNTMEEFLNDSEDADIDMNLVYRWDVFRKDDGGYRAEVFVIQQRKGIYQPNIIKDFEQKDVERFVKFLNNHWKKLNDIWHPIS